MSVEISNQELRAHPLTTSPGAAKALLLNLVVATLYFASGWIGLIFAIPPGVATLLWPPSGLATAVAVIFGRASLPGVFFGSLVLNVFSLMTGGTSFGWALLSGLIFATASTLQAGVAAWLLNRFTDTRELFTTGKNVFIFLGLIIGTSVIAATFGAAHVAFLLSGAAFKTTWLVWYLGDLVGILVLAPAILIWSQKSQAESWSPARWLEAVVFGVLLIVTNYLSLFTAISNAVPISYLLILFVMWSALRFHQRGVVATILVTSFFTAIGASMGDGPFVRSSVFDSLLYSQLFLAIINLTGLVLSAVMSERTRIAGELQSREMSYRAMFEGAAVGKCLLDVETGRIQQVNRKLTAITGYSVDELHGMYFYNLLAPNELIKKTLEAEFEKSLDSDRCIEFSFRTKHHTDIQVEMQATTISDKRERPHLALVIIQDVTGRKQMESERDKLNFYLERTNRELQTFTYGVSHDLKEPLRTIASHLALFERQHAKSIDASGRELLEYAVDAAKRMTTLIDSLLNYGRLDSVSNPSRPVDLNAILDRALLDLKGAIESTNTKITHDPMPTVTGNPTQLIQLLENLIGNAIKFKGIDPPEIHISCSKRDGEWLLSVRDNGIGLDMQQASRIFLPFQRLHSDRSIAGSGLGLTLCRKIVEMHGGSIWVESMPGKGTEFYFTIREKSPSESNATLSPSGAIAPLFHPLRKI